MHAATIMPMRFFIMPKIASTRKKNTNILGVTPAIAAQLNIGLERNNVMTEKAMAAPPISHATAPITIIVASMLVNFIMPKDNCTLQCANTNFIKALKPYAIVTLRYQTLM